MKHLSILMGTLLLFSCAKKAETLEEKAKRIHEKVITIDTHDDINVKNFTDSINYTQNLDTQINLPKMEAGGLDVAWLIVYTGQDSLNADGYASASDNAITKFEAILRLCDTYAPDKMELALTSDDVRRIVGSGKKVAMIGVENAYPIGEDISKFEEYYKRGARYISLSHNGHSQFCDSNTGESDDIWLHDGLSELGKEAVKEMNKLGIMIDISHPSKESSMQIFELSKAPIIASHSSARALCDHSRNLDDEQLLALKENGGVVQTVAFSAYLNTEKHQKYSSYLKNPEKDSISDAEIPEPVNVSDFVDHIDYMVKLIGIDHVGISSDFDGGGGIDGWSDASETFNVTLELVKRGYTEGEIAKLWGENLLRVLDEVQAIASKP
ncbi:dipeptidase [Flagellimonas onchidii]|uniref:dipeptidase n=1 Tax=Flagellimonas onchidii TaxID=2562684 RepID=UPI0010A5DDCA|nr:dipeptidase [Allomuricauda onchidii]